MNPKWLYKEKDSNKKRGMRKKKKRRRRRRRREKELCNSKKNSSNKFVLLGPIPRRIVELVSIFLAYYREVSNFLLGKPYINHSIIVLRAI